MRVYISFLLLFLFLLPNNNTQAQTVKILFDASKAETAGNADWIIDADKHNLVLNSAGVFETGNTYDNSNAQRIPTPAQSGITSTTTEGYWMGAISAWGVECVKYGYQVESLPWNGVISYGNLSNQQDLSFYNIYVVCEPNINYTPSEKDAIVNFVKNGGSLFMISGHNGSDRNFDGWDSPHIWNNLMDSNTIQKKPFGFAFDYVNISQTVNSFPVIANDSILKGTAYGNVTQLKWSSGATMTLNTSLNSTVKAHAYKTGTSGSSNVLVASSRFGAGKVASFSDSSPFDDGTGDPNEVANLYDGWLGDASGNHKKIIMNTTIWLAAGSTRGVYNGVNEISLENNFTLYPNPVNSVLKIESNQEELQLVLRNINGQELFSSTIQEHSIENLNMSQMSAGLYFLTVTTQKGSITKKVIKD